MNILRTAIVNKPLLLMGFIACLSTNPFVVMAEIYDGRVLSSNDSKLTHDQKLFRNWSDTKYGQADLRFEDSPSHDLSTLEEQWINQIKRSNGNDSIPALDGLATIRSSRAVPYIITFASDRREGDNRVRWTAVRALGLIGDESAVPTLIHLTYHYNINTRLWAQISLARITGQNFGREINSWFRWQQRYGEDSDFSTKLIMWTARNIELYLSDKSRPTYKPNVERYYYSHFFKREEEI